MRTSFLAYGAVAVLSMIAGGSASKCKPSPSSASVSSSSSSSAPSASPSCAYSNCFTITAHSDGAAQVDGQLLGVNAASSQVTFGLVGYTTAIFMLTPEGYLQVVSSVLNGNLLGFVEYPVWDIAVCSLDAATSAVTCTAGGLSSFFSDSSAFDYYLFWAALNGDFGPATLTYNVADCPC